jgi:hypothetical protein
MDKFAHKDIMSVGNHAYGVDAVHRVILFNPVSKAVNAIIHFIFDLASGLYWSCFDVFV